MTAPDRTYYARGKTVFQKGTVRLDAGPEEYIFSVCEVHPDFEDPEERAQSIAEALNAQWQQDCRDRKTACDDPEQMIQRTDGTYIKRASLSSRQQLADEIVHKFFDRALAEQHSLRAFKAEILSEGDAYKSMMMSDLGAQEDKDGLNLTLTSACGAKSIKITFGEAISFGPELDAAKSLIGEYLNDELAGNKSPAIHDIINSVFRLNEKGRLDVNGILGLKRKYEFDDPRWLKAMDAIDQAVKKEKSNDYVYFFEYAPGKTPKRDRETRVFLDMAKV